MLKALSSDSAKMPAIGLANEDGTSSQYISVITEGFIENYSNSFVASNLLYVSDSTAGNLTETLPPNSVYNQNLAQAHDSSTLMLETFSQSVLFEGVTWAYQFFVEGNNNNKWAEIGDNVITNECPAIVPSACKLIGIMYSNKNTGVDLDVEVYKNGTALANRVYTLQVRNQARRWVINFSGIVNFAALDRISVFTRDQGDDGDDCHIALLFRSTSFQNYDGGANTVFA